MVYISSLLYYNTYYREDFFYSLLTKNKNGTIKRSKKPGY